jgi:hypothetical protein
MMKETQIIRILAILLLVGVGLLIFRKHVQTEAFADMQLKKKPVAAANPQEMVDAARNLLEKIDNPELLHSMMQTAMGGGLIDPSKIAGFLGSQRGGTQGETIGVGEEGEEEEGEEGQQ